MAPLAVKRLSEIRNRRQETALALQRATKTIPIVATVSDMLGSGLVTSLARPDGNITGVSIAGEADGTAGHPHRSRAKASPDGSPYRPQQHNACEA
jgi:ABC transporter substrate binding protein